MKRFPPRQRQKTQFIKTSKEDKLHNNTVQTLYLSIKGTAKKNTNKAFIYLN